VVLDNRILVPVYPVRDIGGSLSKRELLKSFFYTLDFKGKIIS
jgi:hypothetical protein